MLGFSIKVIRWLWMRSLLSARLAIQKNPLLVAVIIVAKVALKILIVLLVTSCNSGYRYSEYKDVTVSNWKNTDTVTFDIPISKKALPVLLGVRYTEQYKYSNLWIKIIVDGESTRHLVTLFDKHGKPTGKTLGTHSSATLALFDIPKGKHTIQVVQNMRENPLKGISAVGILVKK